MVHPVGFEDLPLQLDPGLPDWETCPHFQHQYTEHCWSPVLCLLFLSLLFLLLTHNKPHQVCWWHHTGWLHQQQHWVSIQEEVEQIVDCSIDNNLSLNINKMKDDCWLLKNPWWSVSTAQQSCNTRTSQKLQVLWCAHWRGSPLYQEQLVTSSFHLCLHFT